MLKGAIQNMLLKRQGTADEVYAEYYINSHIPGRYSANIRGKRCMTSGGFFREYSAAFQFPAYFGENWNAWDECACDLDWLTFSSLAIIIDRYDLLLSREKEPDIARSVFVKYLDQVCEYWEKERNTPCHIVIYY